MRSILFGLERCLDPGSGGASDDVVMDALPDVNDVARLRELEAQLREWNCRINLVSRRSVDTLWDRHVLPCYAAGAVFPLSDKTIRVVDVGCGGGLPGLALAIRFPQFRFTLIDSVGKKIYAVGEIAAALGLGNVTVVQGRAEGLKGRYDVITGRAVADFERFLGWTRHLLDRKSGYSGAGVYYLKGGGYPEELKDLGVVGWRATLLAELTSNPVHEDKAVVYLPLGSFPG